MRTRSMLLVSLLALLAGCQQESSVSQEPAAPVAPAPVVEAPAVSAVAPVASEVVAVSPTPVATTAAKVPAKTPALPQKLNEVVAEKPAAPAAPAAKLEPAVKPEVKVAALSEAEGLALAKKSNCLTCHAIDKKVVGPAWKDVAAKYRSDAGAEERLANVIAKGGRGSWGGMAMPANPQVSEADRRSLAKFVLSLK